MYKEANGSSELMRGMFNEISGNELDVVLAQQNTTIYFTKTHIVDLKKRLSPHGRCSSFPRLRRTTARRLILTIETRVIACPLRVDAVEKYRR